MRAALDVFRIHGELPPPGGEAPARDSVRQASGAALAWSLERSRAQPLAFARAVAETARHIGFGNARRALPLAERVCELLETAAVEDLDPATAQGLRALARGHLADELRMHGRHLEAESALRDARRMAGRRGDPEIYARLLELEADLAVSLGEVGRALRRLDEASGLLADTPIPGRRAELLLRQARANLIRKRPDKARPLLIEAARNLPPDLDLRIRLEIFHNRAAAELSLERLDAAAEAIRQVDHLYAPPVGDDRLLGQRLWLEGQLALERGRPAEGAELLGRSLDLLIERRQTLDSVGAFADWTRALDRAGQLEQHGGEVRNAFHRLVRLPGIADLGRAELERWLDFAASRGLMTSSLQALRRWLDRENPPVH
ncbi:MAG: hypothetical protein MI919_03480 [Holophagales bacterium]|nr:hypothetical protein [Holophagales bacterium]